MSDDSEYVTHPKNSNTWKSKQDSFAFTNNLIDEVKKRPFLWDKKHKLYGCRGKFHDSWVSIAKILKKRPDEVKAKWRNLKDSFHRLEKRIEYPEGEDASTVPSYKGQWIHFEKLLFLKDTRQGRVSNEVYIETEVPGMQVSLEDIKEELDISEQSNESEDLVREEKGEDSEQIFAEPVITLQSVLNGAKMDGADAKRRIDRAQTNTGKREEREETIDDDLLFVKSLVPFMRKLNPIRKLVVRNEMQNLLIKEMLCENCRTLGPQPNCKCDFS